MRAYTVLFLALAIFLALVVAEIVGASVIGYRV